MSDGNDVETLRGTLEAAEADCAELRAEVERLRGQASECAALLTERTAQRDGYRAAASEWERLRNEAYRQFREASDERDERAAFAAAETGHANEWSRRAHASEDAYLRVCQALGMVHDPEGQAQSPAPLEAVLLAIKELLHAAACWHEAEGAREDAEATSADNALPLSDEEIAGMREYLRPLAPYYYRQDRDRARLLATIAHTADQMRLSARLERGRCAALLREAADSVHASLAEEGITSARKEYRMGLEARLRTALSPTSQSTAGLPAGYRKGACICPCHDTPHGPCRCACAAQTEYWRDDDVAIRNRLEAEDEQEASDES